MKRTISDRTVGQEERGKLVQLAIVAAVSRMLSIDPAHTDEKAHGRDLTHFVTSAEPAREPAHSCPGTEM
jgi:hypothetical protein